MKDKVLFSPDAISSLFEIINKKQLEKLVTHAGLDVVINLLSILIDNDASYTATANILDHNFNYIYTIITKQQNKKYTELDLIFQLKTKITMKHPELKGNAKYFNDVIEGFFKKEHQSMAESMYSSGATEKIDLMQEAMGLIPHSSAIDESLS